MSRYDREILVRHFVAYLAAGHRLRYVTRTIEKHVTSALEEMQSPDDLVGLELAYARVPLQLRADFRSAWEHFCTFARGEQPPIPTCGVPKPHVRETAALAGSLKMAEAFRLEALPEHGRKTAIQATKVRTALRRMASVDDAAGLVRYYNSLAPSSQRVFRNAWKEFVAFWHHRGVSVPELRRPRRGRPPRSESL